jgi:hypothetical protein
MPDGGTEHLSDIHPSELLIEPLSSPRAITSKRKEPIRIFLAAALTLLIVALFVGYGIRLLFVQAPMDPANRETFTHLFELLLVTYGTVLGFYFGAQD